MFSESVITRYWKYVEIGDDCWKWSGTKCKGYGQLSNGRGKSPVKAHRVSWFIHHGAIPKDMFVCHKCDDPECTNPNHLFLGTQSDNMRDAYNKGRIDNYVHASGEKNNVSTLTSREVKAIRKDYSAGLTMKELSIKYNHSNIMRIVRNICYFDPNYKPINGNRKPRPFRKKINKQDIEYIKNSKLSSRRIAKTFNVSKTTILKIKKGEY